jgi:hypothetical protein
MRGVVTFTPLPAHELRVGWYNSPSNAPVSTGSRDCPPGGADGKRDLQRTAAVFALFALASAVLGGGTAVAPLDPGEWLSGGLAVWLGRALDNAGRGAAMADPAIAPGDLVGMTRAAAAGGFDRLLVVNCAYLGERVTVDLLLFDTAGGTLLGSWRGLINYDALQRELPSGLAALCGDFPLPGVVDPARFLDDRRADFTARFGG